MKLFFLKFIVLCLFSISSFEVANAEEPQGGSKTPVQTGISTAKAGPKEDIATKVICNVVNALAGPVSQGIATLVIIITGYSFFVGKVSIGMLMIVAAGIMFVFGAQTIMGWILGSNVTCAGGEVIKPATAG